MNEKIIDAVKGVSSAVGDVSGAIKGADQNVQTVTARQAERQGKSRQDAGQHSAPPSFVDSIEIAISP
ncbi:MAG: hypothetical protein F9K47_17045 [Burkholderiales bacterium]|nr:MAG: hypothetical protein F9K47_17045 [Burkholderiales bacterium]